jgi:ABC-2 type transport system ATP-binding protein
MSIVEVNHISKSYADKIAVNDVSFMVDQGEIFGIIGQNGAGKTTTIRVMMNIIRPDSGDIKILGENLSEASKNNIGYMPEERGLYKKLSAIDAIIYLASLKGMDRRLIEKKADELLEKTGMLPHKRKKIEEMSKGMGQLIQFIVTIIHDPDIIILDEPFTGLDPSNVELLKTMIADLRNQGKAVFLSAHSMNDVEELCDRILMIKNGREVLYGSLAEIKSRFRTNNSIYLDFEGDWGEIQGVSGSIRHKGYVELMLEENITPQHLLEQLVSREIMIKRFEIVTPTLNEIFLKVAGDKNE